MANNGKSQQTSLRRARYLGSARLGTEEAWLLRVTATALVPLAIGFVWLVLSLLHKDYNGVRAELSHPIPAIVVLLFVVVGLYHVRMGMSSIILDYVHGHARDWALMANTFFAVVLGLACVYAVLRIGFV